MEKKIRQSAVYHLNKRGCGMRTLFLGRVRKISKIHIWLHYVCLSVRIEHLGTQWTDFHEILIFHNFFENMLRKFKFH